ncbi:MAG: hypothetical protein H0U49_03590 [Parachlamydiaceae bacterium]|nr:hypothetical protein [Parachlamydiaceae bacterium]
MTLRQEFMSIIQQIRTSAKNLSKDVDQNDPREETNKDLKELTLGFQDLREIISNIKQEEQEDLNREFRELLSGQEDFQTYTQDVKMILMDIKNRIKSDKKVEEKITKNLPAEQKNETPNSLFQGFGSLMEQISRWTEKAGYK